MEYKRILLVLSLGLLSSLLLIGWGVDGAPNAADYYIRSLPGLPDSAHLKQHAGHIVINEATNANMFFWLIHNRHIADRQKFVIWLNGGPGCSSMDGLFLEVGPWRMNKDQTLRMINGSWDEYANLLFVDQPVGTGFSFSESNEYPKTMIEVTDQFMVFLDSFFDIFPEYAKDEMYIAGESFAGTFIPYITSAILKRNAQRKTTENRKYNIKGILIGNGWIDPVAQYKAYYTFSVDNNILTGDYKTRADELLDKCMFQLNQTYRVHVEVCESILATILDGTIKVEDGNKTCINEYDIRLRDTYPECGMRWPYDLDTITEYLRRPDVVSAIHADAQKIGWRECNGNLGSSFDDDASPPSVTLLPDILKKIPVALFSGDKDLICNTQGTVGLIANLEWNGAKGFQDAPIEEWYVNNTLVGTWQTERNLSLIIVKDASHMVPYDVPLVTMDMANRFMGLDANLPNIVPSKIGKDKSQDDTQPPASSTEDDEMWDRYYNAGTATLIIVVLAVAGLGVFMFRGRIFKRRQSMSQTMKKIVEGDTTELDELVIETPEDVDHFGDSEGEEEEGEGGRIEMREYKDDENGHYKDESNENINTQQYKDHPDSEKVDHEQNTDT